MDISILINHQPKLRHFPIALNSRHAHLHRSAEWCRNWPFAGRRPEWSGKDDPRWARPTFDCQKRTASRACGQSNRATMAGAICAKCGKSMNFIFIIFSDSQRTSYSLALHQFLWKYSCCNFIILSFPFPFPDVHLRGRAQPNFGPFIDSGGWIARQGNNWRGSEPIRAGKGPIAMVSSIFPMGECAKVRKMWRGREKWSVHSSNKY